LIRFSNPLIVSGNGRWMFWLEHRSKLIQFLATRQLSFDLSQAQRLKLIQFLATRWLSWVTGCQWKEAWDWKSSKGAILCELPKFRSYLGYVKVFLVASYWTLVWKRDNGNASTSKATVGCWRPFFTRQILWSQSESMEESHLEGKQTSNESKKLAFIATWTWVL
jgi:hypothetical protein